MTADRIDPTVYSARYAEQYAVDGFEPSLVAIRRAHVLASLSRYDHGHVLEVGCGLEPLFTFVDGWNEFTVVESSPEFAQNARALSAGRADVRVVEGYFEESHPSLQGVQPDVVIVSSLLHEVPDPRALLRAVRSVSGPSTVTHLNVPNVRSFHRLLALEMGLIESVSEPSEMEVRFQRHTRYDLDALTALVTAEGFRVLRSGDYFIKPFTHAQMHAMLSAGIIDVRVLEGLDRMTRHLPGLGSEIFVDVAVA